MSSQPPSFPGFPASAQAVAVPGLFFSQVLPQIERPEELIVTLYLFFAQGRAKGRRPPFLTDAELAADRGLVQALANFSLDPQAALAQGLALAVERGTPLRARIESRGR
ncbi:MAG: primosomal replication protein N, partial [Dehalococcoidia bacterium]